MQDPLEKRVPSGGLSHKHKFPLSSIKRENGKCEATFYLTAKWLPLLTIFPMFIINCVLARQRTKSLWLSQMIYVTCAVHF